MFVVLLLCLLAHYSEGFGEATYVLIFESPIYTVGEGSSAYIDSSRVICERYNESTAVMHGELEFLKDIDDLILEVILKKEAAGKHEVVFSHDICDICDEISSAEGNYGKFLKYLEIPKSCPMNSGVYKINNLVIDIEEFEIKDTQCGPYVAELHMHKRTGENCKNDRELLFTLLLDFIIEREG